MGAKHVTGIDLDKRAISVADENARNARAEVDWVVGNLDSIRGSFTTAVMNPPYGTRVRHGDVAFQPYFHAGVFAPVEFHGLSS